LQGQGNLKSIKFKILFDHHFKEEEEVLAGKSQDQREVSPLSLQLICQQQEGI
jgi:hypothetical protein